MLSRRPPGPMLAALLALAVAGIVGLAWRAGAEPAEVLRTFARPAPTGPLPGEPEDGRLAQRAALGLKLFRDKRLSRDESYACESCHYEGLAFADPRQRAVGFTGETLERNTPAIWNLAWAKRFGWLGRDITLEQQVVTPVVHAKEMGGDWPQIVARLEGDEAIRKAFAAAFPGEAGIREETVARALAAYVRAIVSPLTSFDRYLAGDTAALSAAERDGFSLFVGGGRCVQCHQGWRFTDDGIHQTGAADAPMLRTPTLRELLWSGPYLHDGSAATLKETIGRHAGSLAKAGQGPAKALADAEVASLVRFLETLSSEDAPRPVARP